MLADILQNPGLAAGADRVVLTQVPDGEIVNPSPDQRCPYYAGKAVRTHGQTGAWRAEDGSPALSRLHPQSFQKLCQAIIHRDCFSGDGL